jgi:hypothetical protein
MDGGRRRAISLGGGLIRVQNLLDGALVNSKRQMPRRESMAKA